MKKIILGCAAVLLSLGLLAGCNKDDVDDKINNTGPEENEPTDDGNEGTTDTGPGPEEGGSGTGTTEPVAGTVAVGDYWLGFEMSGVDYYFDGTVYNTDYAGVTSDGWDAVTVTVAEAGGGYTLSFVDENAATQYLKLAVEDTKVHLRWSEDEEFVWIYDTTYETFVAYSSDTPYFVGTFGTYKDLCLNDYGYLTGDKSTSYAQYPAKLYTPIDYSVPASISISGADTVAVYGRVELTATILPENAESSLVWSWTSGEGSGEVMVSNTGVILGVAAGTVTVTATSAVDPSVVSNSVTITVSEATDAPAEGAYRLGVVDKTEYCYRWFNGTSSTNLDTTDNWEEAADVYIKAVNYGNDNACTLSFYVDESEKYISCPDNTKTGTSIADDSCTWYWNEEHQLFALGTTVGGTSNQDRGLAYYQNSKDIRAYATTSGNLTQYSWFNAYK